MLDFYAIVIAILASVLILVAPVGIGLCLLSNKNTEISRLQILLFSYLFGAFLVVFFFVFFERIGELKLSWQLVTLISVMSFLGFIKSINFLKISIKNKKSTFSFFILFLYIILIHYFLLIVIYSEFPIVDLFQRVHFHAGALSFSEYGILNPFYANSYIPFQQVMLGLLSFFKIDLLLMEWILPLIFTPMKIVAIYLFVEKFIDDEKNKLIIVCLIISILGVSNPTNGDISQIAIFIFLSFLFSKNIENESINVLNKIGFSLIVFLMYIFILKESIYFLAFLMICFLLIYHYSNIRLNPYVLLALSIFLVLVFHRSGLMYIPFALFMYGLYSLFYMYKNILIMNIKYLILLLIVSLFFSTAVILLDGGNQQDIFGLWKFFDLILNPLVGKSLSNLTLDKDLAIGSGAYISLFEIGRSMSLFLLIVSISMFIYFNFIVKAEQIKSYKSYIYKSNVLLFISLVFIGLVLTGFPFIHRSSFLIIGVLSIVTVLYFDVFIKIFQVIYLRFIAIFSLLYIIFLVIIVNIVSNAIIDIYVSKIYTLLIILAILIVLTILFTWNEKRIKTGIFFIFILTILFETLLQKSYFKRYAFFGQIPENGEVFSHFNHKQLEVADILSKKIDNPTTLIVSDPKTMALIGARTGNSPITSFSNLNTMPDETEKLLVDLLKRIKRKSLDNQICEESLNILDSHSSSTSNYIHTKLDLKNGALALSALGYNNALVPQGIEKKEVEKKEVEKKEVEKYSFIIVINYDTLRWIDTPKDFLYFPQKGNYEDIRNLIGNKENEYIINEMYIKELSCLKRVKDKNAAK